MRKVMHCICFVLLVILIGVGYFYYTVYSSQYTYKINVQNDKTKQTSSFKIGTYNIKSLNYNKDNLKQFKQDIQDLNLDIICLQEVDKNAKRSGHIDMMKELAKENNYPYSHFYKTMWILNGYYGLGILSRYPIKEVSSLLLPNSLIKEPRILTKTTVLINNQEVDIYNTHLTYENNEIRTKQMNKVKEEIDFNKYTILTGDFNSFGINQDFKIEGIESINQNKEYMTFRDFALPDDIYYSSHFSKINQGVKMTSFSDHNLLYGEFEFK